MDSIRHQHTELVRCLMSSYNVSNYMNKKL